MLIYIVKLIFDREAIMNSLTLTELIDTNILQQIQDSFSAYTGIASVITDSFGTPITKESGFTEFCYGLTRKSEKGLKRCEECDKNGAFMSHQTGQPAVYICHAGLIDFAAPIILNGQVIGSVVGGQVTPGEIDEEKFRAVAKELGIDPDKYVKAAYNTYSIPIEQVRKSAAFLSEIAKAISAMAYNSYVAITKSRKMERAARSQAVFITNLTDDLRSGMKSWLSSFSEISEKCGADKELSSELNKLLGKGREVYSVIDGAVDYMKFTGGSADFSEGKYNIRELIENTMNSLMLEAENKNIEMSIRISEELPEILVGNSGRIGQIVSKLIQNSIQFMDNGGIISVSVSSEKELYSDRLIIEVEDNGNGMSGDILEKVRGYFEETGGNIFSYSDDQMKNLDFPLLFLLIRQMSGKIDVRSSSGRGTVFTLVFPQLTADSRE